MIRQQDLINNVSQQHRLLGNSRSYVGISNGPDPLGPGLTLVLQLMKKLVLKTLCRSSDQLVQPDRRRSNRGPISSESSHLSSDAWRLINKVQSKSRLRRTFVHIEVQ